MPTYSIKVIHAEIYRLTVQAQDIPDLREALGSMSTEELGYAGVYGGDEWEEESPRRDCTATPTHVVSIAPSGQLALYAIGDEPTPEELEARKLVREARQSETQGQGVLFEP